MDKLTKDCEYIKNILNNQENDLTDEELDYILINVKNKENILKLYRGDYNFNDDALIILLEDLRFLEYETKIKEIMILMRFENISSEFVSKYLIDEYLKIPNSNNTLRTSIYYDLPDLFYYLFVDKRENNLYFNIHDEINDVSLFAAKYNSIKIIKYIIDNHLSKLNLQDIFQEAISNNSYEIVELLLDKFIKNINIDANNNKALSSASSKGYYKIVELLIKYNVIINNNTFLEAIKNNKFDIVKLLIEHGFDINNNYNQNLLNASYLGHYDIVKYLLENGTSDIQNNTNNLYHATRNGHYDVVELLLKYGAKTNYRGHSAFMISFMNKQYTMFKLLLKHSTDIHLYNDQILELACNHNNYEMVQFLLDNGFIINHREIMTHAISNSNILKLLLDNGGFVNITHLIYAIENNYYESTKLILEQGIIPNAKIINNLLRTVTSEMIKLIRKYR